MEVSTQNLIYQNGISKQKPRAEANVLGMPKTKPNSRCPCGSGKKFKKCCKNKETVEAKEYVQKNPKQCIGVEQTLSFFIQTRPHFIRFQAFFSALQKDPNKMSKADEFLLLSDGVQDGIQQLTNLAHHLEEVKCSDGVNSYYANTWNDTTTATFLSLRRFILPFLARMQYTDQWCKLGLPGDDDWSCFGPDDDKRTTWRKESSVYCGIEMLMKAITAGCFALSEKETRIIAKIVFLEGIHGMDMTWGHLDVIIFSGKRHAIDGLAKEIQWLKKNEWSGQALLANLSLICLTHGCEAGGGGSSLDVATWTTKDDVRAACELVVEIFLDFRHDEESYEHLFEGLTLLVKLRPDFAQTAWDTLGLSMRTHLATKAVFVCECDWKEEGSKKGDVEEPFNGVDLLRVISISIELYETQQQQKTNTTASTTDESIFAYLTEDKRVQNLLEMKRCAISRTEASWQYFLSEFQRDPTNIPVCACCLKAKGKPLLFCNWEKGIAERNEIEQVKKSAEEAAAQDHHAESLVLCQTALDLIASQKDPDLLTGSYPTLLDTIQLLTGKVLFQLGRYRESIKMLDNSLPPNYGWGGGLKGNSNGSAMGKVITEQIAKRQGLSVEAYKQKERTRMIDCGAHEACVHSLLMRAKFSVGFTKDVRNDAEMLLRAKLKDGEDPIGLEDIAQAQKHAREILVELDASTLRMHRSGKCCAYCKNAPGAKEKFNACSNCLMYRYCSKECQKKHWKTGHKEECLKGKETAK